ncbi:DNA-directed RNA polymerase subunit N [Candidatus Woesearchaeota archaeon]|nr:DNA-directed RNA polymerase subunit N [Candidatus Woesearchaeota archaeon]MBW3016819.1 DNA-directed RNA polymerase subunit N [Candidatus Woesearchaeota archaeon]
MIIPVRCQSCGRPIAHLWDEFKERTEKKGEDKKKVLDELELEKYCCRAAFLGQKDLIDVASKFKKW